MFICRFGEGEKDCFGNLDVESKRLALYYLNKAANNKHPIAILKMERLKQKGLIPLEQVDGTD